MRSGIFNRLAYRAPLALFAFLTGSFPAPAQEDIDCENAQNTMEMRYCSSKDFEAADKRLNKAYRTMSERLEAEPKGILKTSQRAWLAFRDAECEFQSYWTKGGTASPGIGTQCMATLTDARATQLEAYVNCEEGDMVCPPME